VAIWQNPVLPDSPSLGKSTCCQRFLPPAKSVFVEATDCRSTFSERLLWPASLSARLEQILRTQMGRRCSRGDGCARTALLLAALATTSWESRPGSLLRGVGATGSAPPRDGALQPDASLKLVITPTFGQCFSNGTTTFRSNAPVKWTLFPMDGNVPYTTSGATPTSLTLRAGRHGGRMLVVAAATACAAGSPCAEQLGSPACAGVAAGETTLAQVGANLCSAAFANASWTVVPWWKVRIKPGRRGYLEHVVWELCTLFLPRGCSLAFFSPPCAF
jgi:hypothetical protein